MAKFEDMVNGGGENKKHAAGAFAACSMPWRKKPNLLRFGLYPSRPRPSWSGGNFGYLALNTRIHRTCLVPEEVPAWV